MPVINYLNKQSKSALAVYGLLIILGIGILDY